MGRPKKFFYYGICSILFVVIGIQGRSPLRSDQAEIPHLIASWKDGGKKYHLKSWHIEENSIFHKFDRAYFMDHLLPTTAIPYRYDPEKSVSGELLSNLIENLVQEIHEQKKEYTHFTILKKRDFNRKQKAGLLIVRFKEYPFVVKLFLETPESFVKPFSKGWQSGCFFIMGGGISRYLSGFTRLRNHEIIQQQIANDPYWCNKIGLPRKWGWLSKNTRWFTVQGINVGPRGHCSGEFPSIYAIVSDFIEGKPLSFWSKKDRELGIKMSKFFTNRIDANIDNLVREPLTAYKHPQPPQAFCEYLASVHVTVTDLPALKILLGEDFVLNLDSGVKAYTILGVSHETKQSEIDAIYAQLKQRLQASTQNAKTREEQAVLNSAQHLLDCAYSTVISVQEYSKLIYPKPPQAQLVLIDTEHFPTFVGLKKPLEFDSYTEWYLKLTMKYLKDGFFRTKQERLQAAREEPFNLIPL